MRRLAWTVRYGEHNEFVNVVDVDGWKDRARVEVEGYGKRLALSATGDVLAVLSEYRVTMVDVRKAAIKSDNRVRQMQDPDIDAFALSPDAESTAYVQAGVLH
jgi:hypothetical protein